MQIYMYIYIHMFLHTNVYIYTYTYEYIYLPTATHCSTLQHTATYHNILQHTATFVCKRHSHEQQSRHSRGTACTLQHTATKHTATHHTTTQHNATHCNTCMRETGAGVTEQRLARHCPHMDARLGALPTGNRIA